MKNIEDTLELLNTLPARVGGLETQFLQFRTETRQEFSALKGHVGLLHKEALAHTDAAIGQLRQETLAQFAEVHDRIDRLDTSLRQEFKTGMYQLADRIKALLNP